MTDPERIQKLVQLSLNSDCEHEKRFALVMGRVLAMREAIQLEHDVEHEQLSAALFGAGLNAIDACIEVLSMYWGRQK